MRKGYVVGIILILLGGGIVAYDFAERHMARSAATTAKVGELGLMNRAEDTTITMYGCFVIAFGVIAVFAQASVHDDPSTPPQPIAEGSGRPD